MEKLAKNRNCIWKFVLIVLTMTMLISPIFAVWHDNNLDYRKQINITNVGGENLTDFPIYINVSYENRMQTDYDDIRFVSDACGTASPTVLDYEIEYNDSNHAVVWVKIPTLAASGTNICMYYGNSTVSTTESPTAVWKSNYGIVYHMNSAGDDSTSNNRDKVSDIGVPTADNTILGYGTAFGNNIAWNLQDLSYWEIEWFDRTHEILFTTVADINTRQTLFAEGGGTNGIMMYILNGQLYARWWSESAPNWGGNHFNTSIAANTTYHAVMHLTEFGDYGLYLNGVRINNASTPDHMDAHSGNGGIAYTGGNTKDYHDGNSGGNYFRGSIHEFRTFNVEESDAWINMSAQNMINHTSTVSYSSQESRPEILQIDITSPSIAGVYPIGSNETLTLNATVTCTSKSGGCGNITSNSEYNSTPTIFSIISTFSGTNPMWTSSGQAKSCILNSGGSSCDLSWIVNVTDSPGNEYRLRITGISNLTEIPTNNSDELTIEIIAGAAIIFNQTTYDFGNFFKNSGDRNVNISVTASVQNSTGINVTCESGDCATITDNWIDGTNLNEGNSQSFTLTCSDNTIGTYSATYSVVSSEDTIPNEIVVSCTVDRVYGPLMPVIITPPEGTTKEVGQNRTFTFEANVSCNGTCGNITAYAIYSQNLGDGSDGSLTVTSADTIVNNYTYLTATENSGQTVLSVNDASEFGVDDEILIIQMQDGSGSGSAGNYEFATIASTGVGTITVDSAISNTYGSGTFDTTSASATQIVRIPHYTDVTINSGASITAPAWNGFSGGIVVFRSQGIVNTTGYINVSEKGYRGGDCNGCGDNAAGDQGEGTSGIGTGVQTANGIGGGGGYGPTGLGGEPGAGGGHATGGGNGLGDHTTDATGGGTIGVANLSTIYFGGGAGAGGDNDNVVPLPQDVDGGGIAIIFAQEIINGNILARGENGFTAGGFGGTTGGGAGGSIWLAATDININDVNASGGSGGVNGGDIGGDGGDGRVRLDYSSVTGGPSIPSSGHNGSTNDIFSQISTTSGDTPLWTSSPQPQNCIVAEDGSCLFTWTINATGPINSSVNISIITFSNFSQITANTSGEVNISIVDQVAPTITLVEPANNSKIIGNGTIDFIWTINDDNTNLTCSFYLNGVLNQTLNCTNVGNNTLTLTLDPAYYNWSIQAIDTQNLSANSSVFYFNSIENYSIRIEKAITSENINQYVINTTITNNVLNSTYNYEYVDFVPTGFTVGSDVPNFSFFNLTSGTNYNGRIYVWNLNTTTTRVTYSLAAVGDYKVGRLFMIGLD